MRGLDFYDAMEIDELLTSIEESPSASKTERKLVKVLRLLVERLREYDLDQD